MTSANTRPEAAARYVDLIRVSTRGQRDSDTPEIQRRALDHLARARPGTRVDRIDVQVSGAANVADRPDLQRLAALAAERKFDEIRVFRIDRLTRHEDPVERLFVLSLARRLGAVIVEASGAILDPATMAGELSFFVQALGAADERKKILDRTLAGKARLAKEGRPTNGCLPFARRFNKATGVWSTDPGEAKVYRRLFDLILGGLTLRRVAARLNDDGVPSPRGARWTAGMVHRLITVPHAVGRTTSHGVAIQIPPIVDDEVQRAALARLAANDIASGRHDCRPALLRKLATCGVCGGALYTDSRGGDDPGYYYCKRRDVACMRNHRAEDLDAVVKGAVEAFLKRRDVVGAAAGFDPQAEIAAAKEAKAAALRDLRNQSRRQENLIRLVTLGHVPKDVEESQLREIARARAAAQRAVEAADVGLDALARRDEQADALEAAVQKMRKGIEKADFNAWRALMERVFDRAAGYSVAVWPDGRVRLRAAIPLDGTASVGSAERELSRHSRTS